MKQARRVVVVMAAAGAMLVGGATSAAANVVWCVDDPTVQVQTASGTNLTVHTSVSVPNTQAKFLSSVTVQAVTAPDGAGGTLVSVYVTVPANISSARVTASVQKNLKVASETATVAGGQTATILLDVPTA